MVNCSPRRPDGQGLSLGFTILLAEFSVLVSCLENGSNISVYLRVLLGGLICVWHIVNSMCLLLLSLLTRFRLLGMNE